MTQQPPGTQPPRRWRPRLHWELLVCATRGHGLVGSDAAELREQDAIFGARGGRAAAAGQATARQDEIVNRASVFKVLAFVVNIAVVVYLLLAKRLFGLRGGNAADEAEARRDQG
jgi:hypothetical protein